MYFSLLRENECKKKLDALHFFRLTRHKRVNIHGIKAAIKKRKVGNKDKTDT